MFFLFYSKYCDFGLLFLRVVFGLMFIYYGMPKLFGGVGSWAQLGQAMANLGIHFFPVAWGFVAASSMFFGGICLLLGLFFRPACLFLFFTMFVAAVMHLAKGDGLFGAGHAIEDGAVFLALIFIGAGKFSLDKILWGAK